MNGMNWVNDTEEQETLDRVRDTIRRSNPFGKDEWAQTMAKKFGLESTLKPRGRPRKST